MIVLSLFGTTTGLEVQHFIPGGGASPVKIDNVWLEVSPTQVSLRSDDNCYQIHRRQVDGKIVTWIGLYRAAREIGYDRQGGFYGAGVWLFDVALDSKTLTETLVNLADQVRYQALADGKFTKRLSDIRAQIAMPPQMSSLAASITSVSSGCSTKGVQAFIADPTSASLALDWAQKSRTAELFNQVFIASAEQYVSNKNEFQQTFRFNQLFDAVDSAYTKRINDLSLQSQELNKKNLSLNEALQSERLNHQDAVIALKQQDAKAEQAVRQLRHELDVAIRNKRDQEFKINQLQSDIDRLRGTSNTVRQPMGAAPAGVMGPTISSMPQPAARGIPDLQLKMTASKKPGFQGPSGGLTKDQVNRTAKNKKTILLAAATLAILALVGSAVMYFYLSPTTNSSENINNKLSGDVASKNTTLADSSASTEQPLDKASTSTATEQCANETVFVSFRLNKAKSNDKALTSDEILTQLRKSCSALSEISCPKDLAKIDEIKAQLDKTSDKKERVILLPEVCAEAIKKNPPASLSLTLSQSSGTSSENSKTSASPKAK